MGNLDYSLVNGITLDKVIDLIPIFDILQVDFIYYMKEFWFDDIDILHNKDMHDKLFKSCSSIRYKVDTPLIIHNNGNFLSYDIEWDNCMINFIVIGYMKKSLPIPILELYRDSVCKEHFEKIRDNYEIV